MQSFKYKEKERNKLYDIFNNAVYSIQQKEGLNNLILEKKIGAVSEELEVKNLQLNEVLKAAHIDGRAIGAITKSIEEIESNKNDLINDLQNQLQQIRRAHTHMVKAYEGKLAEFVIPVEELGFDPLVPTNVD
jgi:growth arrest-specific protein 8